MLTQKLIFFTLPRSASTYMCNIATACMENLDIEYTDVNPELTNIAQWKSNEQGIIDSNRDIINSLGLDPSMIDHDFIKTLFLYYIAYPMPIVLKYFPFDCHSIPWDEFIAVVKRHNVRVICLYRINILDYLISQLVVHNVGNLDFKNDELLSTIEYTYNVDVLNRITVRHYELFFKFYTEFTSAAIIEKTIAYENMCFNSTKDAALLFDNVKLKKYRASEKIVSKQLKKQILKQHPTIVSDLIAALKATSLPIINDYYLDLSV